MPIPVLKPEIINNIHTFELDPTGNWKNNRPAWLLDLGAYGNAVLKAEVSGSGPQAMAEASAKWGGKLMKQISPLAKPSLITPAEKQVLLGLPDDKFTNLLHRDYLKGVLGAPIFIFYKMEFVENLKSAEKMVAENKGDKLMLKLKNKDTMVKLGEIIAADMFNGNEDRFNKKGDVVNVGNIVFQKMADKTYTPVGLDFFEAGGQFSGAHKSGYGDLNTWSGATLRTKEARNNLARNVLTSLNALNATGLQLNMWGDLKNLTDGIAIGAEKVKHYLTTKQKLASNTGIVMGRGRAGATRGLPSGIVAKMEFLGWM